MFPGYTFPFSKCGGHMIGNWVTLTSIFYDGDSGSSPWNQKYIMSVDPRATYYIIPSLSIEVTIRSLFHPLA